MQRAGKGPLPLGAFMHHYALFALVGLRGNQPVLMHVDVPLIPVAVASAPSLGGRGVWVGGGEGVGWGGGRGGGQWDVRGLFGQLRRGVSGWLSPCEVRGVYIYIWKCCDSGSP